MKKIIILSIFVIFWRSITTTYSLSNNNAEENTTSRFIIDKIIDLILKTTKEDFAHSIPLEDIIKQSKKNRLLFPADGEMILRNGKMWGIDTIKRYGNVSMNLKLSKIEINFTVQFDEINFWYDFQEITDQILTNGTIKGNLTQLISDIIMEIDTEKKNIELKKFKLLKAKSLTVHVNNQSYNEEFKKHVQKQLSNLKGTITSQIEEQLQQLFERLMLSNYGSSTQIH